jgi:3-dehydroquinate dehydratase I
MRPITVRGTPLAGGTLPAVCVPLVGRTRDALLREATDAASLGPDLLEWRVDHFTAVADIDAVVATARDIKAAAPGLPLLFTRRAQREGGEATSLRDDQLVPLYAAVCEKGGVDLVDTEASGDPAQVAAICEAAHAAGCTLVLSFHDFQRTPALGELLERYRDSYRLGADVAKVAVMPQGTGDVLTLLQATWMASEELPIPVAGMAMGALGAVSRVCGGEFGSALTFAAGRAASAPGQLPLGPLRVALAVLHGSVLRR